jgi:ABC-type lipoprotein release transport system permease subunit
MGMYLTLAWRNIWRNKRRSWIAIASIFFAVIIALFTRSMQLGGYRYMVKSAVSFYTGYVQVHSAGYWEEQSLDKSFIHSDYLKMMAGEVDHVTTSTPRLESFALVSSGEHTAVAMVVGVEPETEDRMTNLRKKVTEGNYLKPGEAGILLAAGIADVLGVSAGDTVVLLGQGYHGVTAAGKYPVTGIVEFPAPDLNSIMSYLPIREAQFLYGANDRVTAVTFLIDGQEHLSGVVSGLRERLDENYEVMSWSDMLPELVQYIEMDNAQGIIMIWIIYMVIGFGILGTLLMMTMERTREFGMLISIGLKRMRLAFILTLESAILSLIAVVIGTVVGIPLLAYYRLNPIMLGGKAAEVMIAYGFEPILPFSMDPSIFWTQALTVLVIAIIAALYPIFRVFKLRPVEAVRT